MKYFKSMHVPSFNLITKIRDRNYVEYINPFLILLKMNIKFSKIFNIQCLESWIMPNSVLEIHKDLDHNLNPNITWSLLCSPINYDNCLIEIYKETKNSKFSKFESVSGFNMPQLNEENAILEETWNMKDGACIFDAGKLWHTARNISNNPVNVFSFRGKDIESLEKLKSIFNRQI
jgi:hypothetical protein